MPVDPDDIQAGEHIFLVAFCITDERERDAAQHLLINRLVRLLGDERQLQAMADESGKEVPRLDSWWVAEDDRLDRSDNDSAVFVPYHAKAEAGELIDRAGFWEDDVEDEKET